MNQRRRFGNRSNGNGSGNSGNSSSSRQHPQQQQRRRGYQQGQQQRHNQNERGGAVAAAEPAPASGLVEGLLSITDDRHDGHLRDPAHPLRPARGNAIVPRALIRDLHLRPGLLLRGPMRGKSLDRVDAIENGTLDEYLLKTPLYDATALDPEPVLKLEHDPAELTTRVIDILTPVGFGQRGLIVAPPRTGKTILMQNIARGIAANYPKAILVLLLVDERPEEVTDMRRNVPGTVYASSNDNTVEKHLDLAQIVIERAKRQVEFGADVVVLMDSLTRVGRAFNTGGPSGGRTLTGGLDNRALEIPKKLFGAARKLEHGGSLTILATCLIDTGSKMDQVIFEEFKGTGNMELTLDRNLANSRIYPAIDIASSGTRKEEKLISADNLARARNVRRHLMNMSPAQAMKSLTEALSKHPTNQSLLNSMRA
jgi:transcription termination factor Rho